MCSRYSTAALFACGAGRKTQNARHRGSSALNGNVEQFRVELYQLTSFSLHSGVAVYLPICGSCCGKKTVISGSTILAGRRSTNYEYE